MKKTASIMSLFLSVIVAVTFWNPISVTHAYTPQTDKVEMSATYASTYYLDYPVHVRQAVNDGTNIAYSAENTINSDADLAALANLYYHKELIEYGDPHDVYPTSENKFDHEFFRSGKTMNQYWIGETHRMRILPNQAYTFAWTMDGTDTGGIHISQYREDGSLINKLWRTSTLVSGWNRYEFTSDANAHYVRFEFGGYGVYITNDTYQNKNESPLLYEGALGYSFATEYYKETYVSPTPEILSQETSYVEYSHDGVNYTRLSTTSTTLKNYYTLNQVIADGNPISLDELAFDREKLTEFYEEYYLLLTLTNPDAVVFGDISVDGVVISRETELAKGYIVNDERTEILVPLTNDLVMDGSRTHTVDWIEVLDNGTFETWTIGSSHSINAEMPIPQTASFISAYFSKPSVTFGEDFDLIIELNNPDQYYTGDLVINGVTYTDSAEGYDVNADYTEITVHLTANTVYGDNIYLIESIEFVEDQIPFDSYTLNLNKTRSLPSNLTFTNNITVSDISIPGTAGFGEIVDLVISLNNPEGLPVNFINISGIEHTVFEINETNDVITIELPVGVEPGEFNYEVSYINFSKNIEGQDYSSSKLIQSPFTFTVHNPIDLANVRVKNFRSEQLRSIVESEFNLVLTIENPNGYNVYSVIINGISYTDISVDETKEIITIPVTAMDTQGTQAFVLDGIRFETFENIQAYNSFLVDDVILEVIVESYAFTNEVEIESIGFREEQVFAGDEATLEIKLNNPNGYEITALSINGRDYTIADFDINDAHDLISISTTLRMDTSKIVFNLDSLSIKRFDEVGTRVYESITEFEVGTIYEKEIVLTEERWWAKTLYGWTAPKFDWLIMTTYGQITAGVVVIAILGGWIYYLARRDKEVRR